MRISLLLFFLVLLLPAAALAQVTLEDQLLHGPVKTLIEEQEVPDEYQRRVTRELIFDEQGIATTWTSTIYSFRDDSVTSSNEFSYDPATREVTSISTSPDGERLHTGTDRYNEQGKLTESITLRADGSVQFHNTWQHDAAGNAIRLEARRSDTTYSYEIDYDAAGNRIASRDYDGDGNLTERGVFTDEGRTYRGERFDAGEPAGWMETRANASGQMVYVLSTDAAGEVEYEMEYVFDENGLKVEERMQVADGEIVEQYEYELDVHGNWTKRITTQDTFGYTWVTDVTYRTFTYY
jgi:YD repeat-containing protein